LNEKDANSLEAKVARLTAPLGISPVGGLSAGPDAERLFDGTPTEMRQKPFT